MNTKFLSIMVAMILSVSVGMAHATPLESLIPSSGAESYWLATPAMNGIEGTTALLVQVALSEKALAIRPPCPKGKVCPPCPKGKICPPWPRPCIPGKCANI